MKQLNKKIKLLFISHSSAAAGGGEDDFERLINYFSGQPEYEIEYLIPPGARSDKLKGTPHRKGNYLWGFLPVVYEGVIPYIKYFVKSFIQVYQFRKFTKGRKYDMCVLNVSVLLWPLIYFKLKKVKSVIFIRETVEPEYIRNKFYRLIRKFGNYFIAVCRSIEIDYRNITEDKRIETLYSSVEEINLKEIDAADLTRYISGDCIEKLSSDNSLKFITVGEIGVRKNQKLILETLLTFKNRGLQVPIALFVGNYKSDNSYTSDFFRFLKENNLEDNCIFTGELPRSEFIKCLKLSDAVLITSHSEGMPLTVADAFMNSKPIISTKVGGVPEAVIDGFNGYLVEKNTESLFEGISKLYNDPGKLKIFSVNAYNTYAEKFNLNRNLNRLNVIFKEII